MARYVTKIESTRSQAEAFAYMADFANARLWDPSVSEARSGRRGADRDRLSIRPRRALRWARRLAPLRDH